VKTGIQASCLSDLSFLRVPEVIAYKIICFCQINGNINPEDIMSKVREMQKYGLCFCSDKLTLQA